MKKTQFYKLSAYLFVKKALGTYYPITGKWLYEAFLNEELFIFEIKKDSDLAKKLINTYKVSSMDELACRLNHIIMIADRFFIYGKDKEEAIQKLS